MDEQLTVPADLRLRMSEIMQSDLDKRITELNDLVVLQEKELVMLWMVIFGTILWAGTRRVKNYHSTSLTESATDYRAELPNWKPTSGT